MTLTDKFVGEIYFIGIPGDTDRVVPIQGPVSLSPEHTPTQLYGKK